MIPARVIIAMLMAVAFAAIGSDKASALCVLATATATPLIANTGTYTPPASPAAQPVSITISGTVLAVGGALAGNCLGAISFNRVSLPASMLISGGGTATLPYTLQSSSSGGNTLLYTGGGNPNTANALSFSFPASLLSLNNFSITVGLWAQAQPGALQQAGFYSDNITINVFSTTLAGLIDTKLSSQAFTVTGQVAKSCTIGGVTHPSADTATIPITASGAVNTSPINRSYSNAVCNTPTNVQLTSQNGAVVTSASTSGLQRFIDYSALATFSGASASLDTSSIPAISGPESGVAASTVGATPTGTLGVTITPKFNAQPLVAGSYSDTLTITLTPQ